VLSYSGPALMPLSCIAASATSTTAGKGRQLWLRFGQSGRPCRLVCAGLRHPPAGFVASTGACARSYRTAAPVGGDTRSGDGGSPIRKVWLACSPLERKQLLTICISSAVTNLGFGVVIPALPALARELGFGASGVGLLLAVPGLAKLVANLPAGMLSDHVGRVPCMVAGASVATVGVLGTGLFGSLALILPVRGLGGMGMAVASASSAAYLVDLTERLHLRPFRGLIVGAQGGLISAAYVLGPAIGGALTQAHSAQVAYAFVATLTAGCAALYATLPETVVVAASGRTMAAGAPGKDGGGVVAWLRVWGGLARGAAEGWRGLLQERNQQGLLIGNCMLYLNYAANITVIPMQAFQNFGTTPGEIGLLYSAASVVGVVMSPVAGRFADRYGRLALVAPATIAAAMGCLGVAFLSEWSHFVAAYMLWSLGTSMLSPALNAYAADIAPKENTGSALALSRQAQDLVFFLAPPSLGLLLDVHPGPAAMACTAGVTMLGGLLFRLRAREVVGGCLKEDSTSKR